MTVPSLQVVIVTYPEMYRDECESALDNLLFSYATPIHLVAGGATRQESVRNALEYLEQLDTNISLVAIHDGARPFVSQELIIESLATASIVGGAAPALTIHDALKRVDKNGLLVSHIDRSGVVMIQTPQVFRFPEILEAHNIAKTTSKGYVDDSEIFTDAGYNVATIKGSSENIKITTYDDIEKGKR